MNNIAKIVVIAVVVVATAGGAFVLMGGGGDSGEDSVQSDKFISFYLYDNFKYDSTSGVISHNTHLADGIWVKGYGDSKEECFKDACDRAGIPVICSGGYISEWNGSKDGNVCQLGWAKNQWTPDIYLGSEESFEIRYMAIGHGRWSNGSSGEPPKPNVTPDDIKWYWGESKEPGAGTAATFYLYDDYSYDSAPASHVTYASDMILVADGYSVKGYGDTLEDCLRDACKRCFGDNVIFAYNSATGTINRIGMVSANINLLLWNGTEWTDCNLATTALSEGMVLAVCHGPVKYDSVTHAEEVPRPAISGNELGWIL